MEVESTLSQAEAEFHIHTLALIWSIWPLPSVLAQVIPHFKYRQQQKWIGLFSEVAVSHQLNRSAIDHLIYLVSRPLDLRDPRMNSLKKKSMKRNFFLGGKHLMDHTLLALVLRQKHFKM